ncbi:MAG TPA: AsmA-like C-terminal region-containing protein [Phycisphaerae bacterium]|nr:AsmA-like C-terminal region-containing protein [Phycisphaerae bacterium]
MKRLKRLLFIAMGAVAALAIAVTVYYFSGSSAIESWIGSQLLRTAGTYLQPDMHFGRLTYLRPRTVIVDDLTLTSPDPAHAGKTITILAVKKARLELTEIPRRGEPIKFSAILLESPEFRAVSATPGSASLVGFSHLLKGSENAPAPAAASGPASATAPAAPMKLSDWLLMRQVEIRDGKITFDPRSPDSPPIWLDGINCKLNFTPSDSAGNYALATTITRKPAFDLDLEGKINIDTLQAELAKLSLSLDLREENAHYLPPDLQRILKSFEVTGEVHAAASGTLPFRQWQKSTLQGSLDLTRGQVAIGQNRLAVDSSNWQVDLRDGAATLRRADTRLLGGGIRFAGTIPLAPGQPAHISMSAQDLHIQRLLRTLNPGEPPVYAGRVAADISFNAPIDGLTRKAAGGGTFSVREGRIGNIPVIGPILTVVNKSLKKALGMDNRNLSDTADGSLSFAGDSIRIDRLDALSGAMALRGTGTIGFDGRLDLRLNAGPLEALQKSLGAVGQIWASVSDAVAGYHVGGTLNNPTVSLEIGK